MEDLPLDDFLHNDLFTDKEYKYDQEMAQRMSTIQYETKPPKEVDILAKKEPKLQPVLRSIMGE